METEQRLDLSIFNGLKNIFQDAFPTAVNKTVNSAKENINRIEAALESKDSNELESAAHSLKGASAQFGAFHLSELARQLEVMGENAELEKAKEILPVLKSEREYVEKEMRKQLEL